MSEPRKQTDDIRKDYEKLLTPQQAADFLKISVSTIYHLKSQGKLANAAYKIGGSLRFEKNKLLDCF